MLTENAINLVLPTHGMDETLESAMATVLPWLCGYESRGPLPLYSSMDIRDAGFKAAVVDTNIFSAGFNNLCGHRLAEASRFFRTALHRRVPDASDIIIIAEEHTRNSWYLENIRVLQEIIRSAGFQADTATFLTDEPAFCREQHFADFQTASGQTLRVHCLKKVLADYHAGGRRIDLFILNNDLTGGVPEIIKDMPVPVYPPPQAGWHSRLKSNHFRHTQALAEELGAILKIDPWLMTALYHPMNAVDIHSPADRFILQDAASDLLKKIRLKYAEHSITETPYLVIKSDHGTYGMGVLMIEDPSAIAAMNRANRNKLASGKGVRKNHRYLIQEGIPTIYRQGEAASEVCIYQVENHSIGGFFRSHPAKSARGNLNAPGMVFQKMCADVIQPAHCVCMDGGARQPDRVFQIYRVLARVAAIAAGREIAELVEAAA